jgi:hypothetical protein
MAIYTPYFYIIQDKRNGIYYAGAKWGKDSNPSTFMTEGEYATSSETIKELIRQHGLENFIIRKIRTFETAEETQDYETRFLRKIDARNHPRFYNGHNNEGAMNHQKMKMIMLELYGVENGAQTEKSKSNYRKTCLKKYGFEYAFQSEIIKEKTKAANMENLGVEYPSQSETVRNKQKETCLLLYGVENVSQSNIIKDKQRKTYIENYGVDNPSKSEVVKERIKNTLLQNYGVDNPMKSEMIKEKSRITLLEKYGVENASQSEHVKNKKKIKLEQKLRRPELEEIKKYQKIYNLNFGRNWTRRNDKFIKELLTKLVNTYGKM